MKTSNERIQAIRRDFPSLSSTSVVYLDNAATTQKPQCVLEAWLDYHRSGSANVHRAMHSEADRSTLLFEKARLRIAQFVGASQASEIVFTKNATEGLNLLADCCTAAFCQPGDEIILSQLEHHANLLPWQRAAYHRNLQAKTIPITGEGDLDYSALTELLSSKTKIIAVTALSNVLGTKIDLPRIKELAATVGAKVVVDACQSAAHYPIDVKDCDFLVFSGHKVYGPTGVGVLYGKEELLSLLQPYSTGGGMVAEVGESWHKHKFNAVPWRFEAGTPPIAEAIALGAALDYIESVGWEIIMAEEKRLMSYLLAMLRTVVDIQVIGEPRERVGMVSFIHDRLSCYDIATLLDQQGIAVRAGHHCAHPLLNSLGLPGVVRVSLAIYNSVEDIDALIAALRKINSML